MGILKICYFAQTLRYAKGSSEYHLYLRKIFMHASVLNEISYFARSSNTNKMYHYRVEREPCLTGGQICRPRQKRDRADLHISGAALYHGKDLAVKPDRLP
jgi:hypothetical protein